MNNEEIAAAILTKTVVESSPSLRDAIEKHAKKREYSAIASDLAALYGEILKNVAGNAAGGPQAEDSAS